MGEIAEMMLDGTLDCETGEYLGEPCGYPRTAQATKRPWSPRSQKRADQRRRARQRKRDAAKPEAQS